MAIAFATVASMLFRRTTRVSSRSAATAPTCTTARTATRCAKTATRASATSRTGSSYTKAAAAATCCRTSSASPPRAGRSRWLSAVSSPSSSQSPPSSRRWRSSAWSYGATASACSSASEQNNHCLPFLPLFLGVVVLSGADAGGSAAFSWAFSSGLLSCFSCFSLGSFLPSALYYF